MRVLRKVLMMSVLLGLLSPVVFAEFSSLINKENSWYKVSLNAETGFISVLSHTIQFGKTGTIFNYKTEGEQGNVFPYLRFSAKFRMFDTHELVFLYQPLELVTRAKTTREQIFYDTVFPAGTVLNLKYGFSFYRASYVWYFLQEGKNELGMGLSMQIRNASIIFENADGSDIAIQSNVGLVPIIKISGKMAFDNGLWTAIDADAFYASSAIFNGSGIPFVGALWDASVRVGVDLNNSISPYLNIRILGGGSNGTSKGEDAEGDGFTDNWLNTFSVSLGVDFN